MQCIKFQLPPFWSKIKYWIGIILFVGAISYGLWNTSSELWRIQPQFLLLSALSALIMFCFQWWQVLIFLNYHGIKSDRFYPGLFTARKGILNTILPAKTGTFILLQMITKTYHLKWRDYVVFIIIASIVSLIVSVLGLLWLIIPTHYFIVFLLLVSIALSIFSRYTSFPYSSCLLSLFAIALCLYLSLIIAFWCLLTGLGFQISFYQASVFGIALNTLAQISITPANMGIREIVLGWLSPYVALPISVGMIAGATFIIIRLQVNTVILLYLEWQCKKINTNKGSG